MDAVESAALLNELRDLKARGSAFLDEAVAHSPIERYCTSERFEAEIGSIFQGLPQIAAHSSQLPNSNDFLTLKLMGKPLLITRYADGEVHAFLNVCRHRGARLVDKENGCKKLFSCPYHAWTYTNQGALRSMPHGEQGFPDVDKASLSLTRLPCIEKFGFIWVVPDAQSDLDPAEFLSPLESEMAWLNMEDHGIAEQHSITCKANWKLLVEGGIEAYHFKVAHKDTIGPHFQDNLSSYQQFGPHLRSILPRENMDRQAVDPEDASGIREVANVLYTIMPLNQWLVMQDHVAWISMEPLAFDETRLTMTTLAPKEHITPERLEHWKRNHKITEVTLMEDFEIGESTQSGIAAGANTHHVFGRFEGALDVFNREVEKLMQA